MDEEQLYDDVEPSVPESNPKRDERSWAFDVASVFLAILAAVCLFHGFIGAGWSFLLTGMLAAIAAVWFLVWPELLRRRSGDILTMSDNIRALRQVMGDVYAVQREHNRARAAFDRAREAWESGGREMTESIMQFVSQLEGWGNFQEQLMEIRQQTGELSRHIDEWRETAIDYIDFLDLALDMEGLDENYRAAINKVRTQFVKQLKSMGIMEINPDVGDEFDERLHQAEGVRELDGIPPGKISVVKHSGFATGRNVLRPASVLLTPED